MLFSKEIEFFVKHFRKVDPLPQANLDSVTSYPRRTPQDGEIDLSKSIAEQFNQIRVFDPNRYTTFFDDLVCGYPL